MKNKNLNNDIRHLIESNRISIEERRAVWDAIKGAYKYVKDVTKAKPKTTNVKTKPKPKYAAEKEMIKTGQTPDKSKNIVQKGIDVVKNNKLTTALATAQAYDIATGGNILNPIPDYTAPVMADQPGGLTKSEFESLSPEDQQKLIDVDKYYSSGQNLGDAKSKGKMSGALKTAALGIGVPVVASSLLKKKKKKKKEESVQENTPDEITKKFQTQVANFKNNIKRENENNQELLNTRIKKLKSEGFAGALPKSQRKAFNELRKKSSEVLGYKLTGTQDIKVEVDDATITERAGLAKKGKDALTYISSKLFPTYATYQLATDPDLVDYAKEMLGNVQTPDDSTYTRTDKGVDIKQSVKDAEAAAYQTAKDDTFSKSIVPVAGLTSLGLLAKSQADKKKKKKEDPEESYHYNKVVRKK
tara:strand:- start:1284 stop:2531 length:1248 start_codon:yes stop_codon:yes gene_type:complete